MIPLNKSDINNTEIKENKEPSKQAKKIQQLLKKSLVMTYEQYKKNIVKKTDDTQTVFNTFEPDSIKEALKKKAENLKNKKLDRRKTQVEHVEAQYQHRLN